MFLLVDSRVISVISLYFVLIMKSIAKHLCCKIIKYIKNIIKTEASFKRTILLVLNMKSIAKHLCCKIIKDIKKHN